MLGLPGIRQASLAGFIVSKECLSNDTSHIKVCILYAEIPSMIVKRPLAHA